MLDDAEKTAEIEEALGPAVTAVMQTQQAYPVETIAIVMLENQLRKLTDPAAVRALLASLGALLKAGQERLNQVDVKRPSSSRAGYLVPLDKLMPRGQQTWQEEWPQLSAEYYEGAGAPEKDSRWVQQNESVDTMCQGKMMSENIKYDQKQGWPFEDSVVMNLLSIRRAPMIHALNERIESGDTKFTRFSASIHALNDAYIRQAERTQQFGLMPRTYRNLYGHDGLVENEPKWKHIELPDRNGFCGFCAHGITKGSCALPALAYPTSTICREGRARWLHRRAGQVRPQRLPSVSGWRACRAGLAHRVLRERRGRAAALQSRNPSPHSTPYFDLSLPLSPPQASRATSVSTMRSASTGLPPPTRQIRSSG